MQLKKYFSSLLLILGLIVFLNSCTSVLIKIAYNKADWFIKKEIDKLFDITWKQDSILSDGLSLFLYHHRREDLPYLHTFMEKVKKNTLKDQLTIEDIRNTTNEFNKLRSRLIKSMFNNEVIQFISSLDTEQVEYFVSKSSRFTEPREKDNEKTFRDFTDQENHKRRFEKRKKNIITWFGKITPTQEKIIYNYPLFTREYEEIYILEKKRNVEKVIDQLRKQVSGQSPPQKTVQLLKKIFTRSKEIMSPKYITILTERNKLFFNFLIKFHRVLTPEQKKYFEKQANYYIEVVSDLMKV